MDLSPRRVPHLGDSMTADGNPSSLSRLSPSAHFCFSPILDTAHLCFEDVNPVRLVSLVLFVLLTTFPWVPNQRQHTPETQIPRSQFAYAGALLLASPDPPVFFGQFLACPFRDSKVKNRRSPNTAFPVAFRTVRQVCIVCFYSRKCIIYLY
jgi:hypothetical protein